MSLIEFLTWIATSGGAAGIMSFILERLGVFQNLPPERKSLVVLAGSLVLAITAYLILTYVPQETLDQIAPIFAIIYGVAYTWISSQVLHFVDPARSRSVSIEFLSVGDEEGIDLNLRPQRSPVGPVEPK